MKNAKFLILIFVVLSFTYLSSFGQSEVKINSETAENIINSKAIGTNYSNTNFKIKNSYNILDKNGIPAIKVVNFKPSGFIIFSLENAIYPLIAYSFNKENPKENQNTNYNAWINNIINQTEIIRDKNINADKKIKNAWEQIISNSDIIKNKSEEGIEPLLHSNWNQGKYYNTDCPEDNAGPDDHALTGCVATALGQLMNYFRYPEHGTGYYSYTDPTYGFLEMNFAEQFYNWDAMGADLDSYNPDVANLLSNIGISVDMQYGPDGSGMNNHKGAYTLRTFFGYSDTCRYYFRDSLDENFDWPGMLINHLDQNIPLYYAGWGDTIFQMGHAFIVDGYQDSTFFHFNWGWGGSSDGYFNINSLTPSGSDFRLLHEAIAFGTPNEEYPTYCNGQKTLSNLQGCIDDGSGPRNQYSNDLNCEWLISPDDTISYIELNLMECNISPGDELTIFDGSTDEAPILGSYSDVQPEITLESTSDKVLVRFTTDDSEQLDGWLLSYNSEKPKFCSTIQYLTDSTNTITDGSNSYPYQNQTYCNWFIQPEGAQDIRIEFTELDIADGDFVRIQDRTTNQVIASISGNQLPDAFDVISSDVSITFDTDNSTTAGGWALHYAMNVVSVKDYLNFTECNIYPNPAKNKTILSIRNDRIENLEIKLFSIDGILQKSLQEISCNGKNQIDIDIADLPTGLYFVNLSTKTKREVLKLEIK